MTPKPKTIYVNPSQVVADPSVQFRTRTDPDAIADFAEAMKSGVKFPPAITYFDGERHWLSDGFTRHAASEISRKKLLIEVRKGGLVEAKLNALDANEVHGQRLRREDRRKKIKAMLTDTDINIDPATGVGWSDTEIARRLNVHRDTVKSVRDELSCGFPQDSGVRRVVRGGTVYEQNTANIGQKKADGDETPRADAPEGTQTGAPEGSAPVPSGAPANEEATVEESAGQGESTRDGVAPSPSEPETAPARKTDAPPASASPAPAKEEKSEAKAEDEAPALSIEQQVAALPLSQALSLYAHKGMIFQADASFVLQHQSVLDRCKRQIHSHLKHFKGLKGEMIKAALNHLDPAEWEGCPACKGSLRFGERRDPCNSCKGYGYTPHKGEGVSADEVRAYAESLRHSE